MKNEISGPWGRCLGGKPPLEESPANRTLFRGRSLFFLVAACVPGAWFGTGLGRGEEAEDDQGKGRGGKRDLAGASQHHGQGPAAPLTPASPRPALKSVPVPASPEGVCWAPGAKARGLAWDKACRCQTWSSVQRRE